MLYHWCIIHCITCRLRPCFVSLSHFIYPTISIYNTTKQVTGLPESATPSFHIQLSSPIEEQTITTLSDPLDLNKEKSFAEFNGVETSVATLVVKAFDADIPLGSSALYDVKPLCDIDVLKGGERKVSHLDVAIVPDVDGHMDDIVNDNDNDDGDAEEVEEIFQDAKSSEEGNVDDDDDDDAGEDKAESVVGGIAEQTEEITNADSEKEEEEVKADEQVDAPKEDVEEETSEEKTTDEEQVDEPKEDVEEETSEEKTTDAEDGKDGKEESGASPETETETETEGDNDVFEASAETEAKSEDASTPAAEESTEESEAKEEDVSTPAAEESNEESEAKEEEAAPATSTSDSEQKDERTATTPLVPTCVVQMRIEYIPSIKDQKDELYDLLNKASKRKAMAVDKLRKSASALSRASSALESSGAIVKKEKVVKAGFLNKKPVVKKEKFLVRWYNKALGRDSFARKVFPIAKNYILFFGGVALMHCQGQQLALPPPV